MRSVAALRKEVDTALPVPLAQRRPGLAKENADVTNGLGDALERVSLGFTDQIRMADPVFAELMATKETSLLVHDVARLERTSMTAALAAKEVSPELRTRIIDLRGKGDAGWRLLHNLIVSVEKVLAEGTAPPMSVGEFVKASSDLLDVLASIPSAAVDAALARAAAQSAEGRASLVAQGGLLLVSLLLAVCVFLVAWRRVARPIQVISAAMGALADGALQTEIAHAARRDEVSEWPCCGGSVPRPHGRGCAADRRAGRRAAACRDREACRARRDGGPHRNRDADCAGRGQPTHRPIDGNRTADGGVGGTHRSRRGQRRECLA